MNFSESERLQQLSNEYILGGVNSPSRSYKAVGGGAPVVMKEGRGAYLYDVDGNKFIDYLQAYGPIITGHAHPHITKAIQEQVAKGVLFGTPTELEIEFSKKLRDAIPSLEKIRFVNSGTEAVMTTIRVARAYTKRNKIIKFAGSYHGHSDLVLVARGSYHLSSVLQIQLVFQKASHVKSLLFLSMILTHIKKQLNFGVMKLPQY